MKHVLTLLAFALMSSGVSQVPDYIPTDGLMAWYPMNGNALDESGNGFNCQSVGATLTEDRFGIPSSAYTFDGQGSHLQGASLPFSDLSISIWFKPDAGILESYGGGNPPTGAQLIGQGTTHSPCRYCDWAIGVSDWYDGTDQLAWEKANVSSCQVQQSAATWNPEIEVWTHLMAVSEGSNVTFYINGFWVSTIPFEEPLQHGGSVFSIGARYVENCNGGGSCTGPDNAWSGAIDDVAIWNRALTPEEVESVHSSEPTLVGCTDPEACNFNPEAEEDDGSCDYTCCPGPGCCDVGMHWDWELGMCQITNVADTNLDGCVQLNDLLDVLSAYGNCAADELVWQCGDPHEYQGYDYETVQIGEQCWFAENLRTDSFRDGSTIQGDLSDLEWQSLSVAGEGAQATNPLVPSYFDEFGRVYNWHVVDNAIGVCPVGWHVPTDSDWATLVTDVGGEQMAGLSLRSTTGWFSGVNGTNTSGFNGKPHGMRLPDGSFSCMGCIAGWWSSTSAPSYGAWMRYLYGGGEMDRVDSNEEDGHAIRCIHNQD